MNKIDDLIKNKPKLHERVMNGVDRELKRQISAGKEFISDDDVDKLIDEILKEEMGDAWKENYETSKIK